jgi:hypothetical protein
MTTRYQFSALIFNACFGLGATAFAEPLYCPRQIKVNSTPSTYPRSSKHSTAQRTTSG